MIEALALTAVSVALCMLLLRFTRALRRRAPVWTALLTPALYLALSLGVMAAEARFYPEIPGAHRPMRLLSRMVYGYGLCFPVLAVAWALAFGKTRRRASLVAVSLAAMAVLAPVLWSLYVEPTQLRERRYVVRSPRAPARGLTILHVSDLQTDGDCARERKVRALAARAIPDLVVFTGDLMNDVDDPRGLAARVASTHAFLASLRARLAVVVVFGDWDGWGDDWPSVLAQVTRGTHVRVLRNESLALDDGGAPITVHGVLDAPRELGRTDAGEPAVPDLRGAPGLRIVAVHNPDTLAMHRERAPRGGVDLALAGHTHGGQIVLPFVGALSTHTELGVAGGVYDMGGVPLVISRGLGMRGGGAPRVRFLCPPEVSWIDVRR